MNKVFLLLGCNLGNKLQNISIAITMLTKKVGIVNSYSSVYESAAWGNKEQPNFLNQLVICHSTLKPHDILAQIFEIENYFKRQRLEKWGARTMDIDILFYNDLLVNDDKLTIPHPLLHNRKFALLPLNEIAPQFIHPVLGKNMNELCLLCNDELEVFKIIF
ncbi:MAG: 2-amino-4-hydroxy-6-hydroxymethyldihydropteridine diphosphokinase [Sphingobacteriales bacterium]|nr:MAG: 2-amino-4-hydroxy-6-hydroxymethyldihydropteridine diphosphokinase [Sphingobacteriales bacterium]TAF82092.1 MAG: 2-amino-4-hydroxy-6-hydroxymethyldihydropteridine diphosphokinase [Sphingobacteriales bacterium]